MTHGHLQVKQRRAATHDELTVFGIGHGQRARAVGVEFHLAAHHPKAPGLRVVDRRGQHRIVQQKTQLRFRRGVAGKVVLGHLPRIFLPGRRHALAAFGIAANRRFQASRCRNYAGGRCAAQAERKLSIYRGLKIPEENARPCRGIPGGVVGDLLTQLSLNEEKAPKAVRDGGG